VELHIALVSFQSYRSSCDSYSHATFWLLLMRAIAKAAFVQIWAELREASIQMGGRETPQPYFPQSRSVGDVPSIR
jgi:hypothetical protein